MRRRSPAGRVLVIDNRTDGVLAEFGLTREDVDRSVWAIDGAGQRWEGAEAINRVLAGLGGIYGAPAAMGRVPGVALLEGWLYRRVARNRGWLSRFGGAGESRESPDPAVATAAAKPANQHHDAQPAGPLSAESPEDGNDFVSERP